MTILLRIYAKCIFRQRDGAMRRILDATQDEPPEPGGENDGQAGTEPPPA